MIKNNCFSLATLVNINVNHLLDPGGELFPCVDVELGWVISIFLSFYIQPMPLLQVNSLSRPRKVIDSFQPHAQCNNPWIESTPTKNLPPGYPQQTIKQAWPRTDWKQSWPKEFLWLVGNFVPGVQFPQKFSGLLVGWKELSSVVGSCLLVRVVLYNPPAPAALPLVGKPSVDTRPKQLHLVLVAYFSHIFQLFSGIFPDCCPK